jgi:peroxiredoxin
MNAQVAYELPLQLEWANAEPLSLQDLRGRYAVLVFFNASSAFCENVLEQLIRFQAKHQALLNCIGVHIPKFDLETRAGFLRRYAEAMGLNFPVANDAAWSAWQHYKIKVWPSLVLIDPNSNVQGVYSGDNAVADLEQALQDCLSELDAPTVVRDQSKLKSEQPRYAQIRFPAGIAATDRHIYVSDTGRHRILECDMSGNILRVFGSGLRNFMDGSAEEAAFSYPRAIVLYNNQLFVADTGNHSIRKIHIGTGEVQTLLGNGQLGDCKDGTISKPSQVQLNRPSGLAAVQDKLYFTMSGANQLWEFDWTRSQLRWIAGSGALGSTDGSTSHASFAHPTGLVVVQTTAYVLDSASSSLRMVNMQTNEVQTLLGHGLFEFGNQDGPRAKARMQRPTAIALDDKNPVLWIADTYNAELRTLELGGGELSTPELAHQFTGPEALCFHQGKLWIADTAASEILRFDQQTELIDRIPIGE